MNEVIPILDKKRKTCELCGKHYHLGQCSYIDLYTRVKMLTEANKAIPAFQEANRNAVITAHEFKVMYQRAAKALEIAESVMKEASNAEELWNKFNERVEEWLKTLNLVTEESQNPSSPESTTPSETESKQCTGETIPGETTAQDSLQSTPDATRAESPPPSSIT